MSTILVVIALLVLMNIVRNSGRTDIETRLRQQEISHEILDLYFENLSHGSASAIAEYLGRPLGDVQGALQLLRSRRRVRCTPNAYGFPVWHRNAGLY
jgi:hypothetical protein